MRFPFYRLPAIELARLGGADFFPPPPEAQALAQPGASLCIGTKNRSLGDALILSTLPRKLRERYPRLRIRVFPRGMNPVVFHLNPHVSGVDYLPRRLYGDDANRGSGHLITQKENFFGFDDSNEPRPELYLSAAEREWARGALTGLDRPLCLIHPWGTTRDKVLDGAFWQSLVERGRERFAFVQVGVEGQAPIGGCARYFLFSKKRADARKLFALVAAADRLVGVDSGPMHVARAFAIPSCVVTEMGPIDEVFARRQESPYFLRGNWARGFLYQANLNLWTGQDVQEIRVKIEDFLHSAPRAHRVERKPEKS